MPGEESCPVDCSGKKLTTTSGSCNTFTKSRRQHPIDDAQTVTFSFFLFF
ncbi:hypothetical protein B296_00010029 [Ensete ventricosum]|uniref:Uncharacterized protein n=1 Tax=Ensete ventricosum TaxID=4639 RepID=A0A426ZSX4_ENSVE|nr:hypothetical protein B296_00010029 [Ensete ventricosum]